MNEAEILHWFADTWLGAMARDVPWLWPTLEIIHFMGLCILFGSLLIVDLRVLGVGRRLVSLDDVMPFIPVALGGFALNLLSGITFFCASPSNYWMNEAFRWKMALVVLGGVNALAFELFERRRFRGLAADAGTGLQAKVFSAASLGMWIAVIVLGRFLPFTGGIG